MLSMSVCGCSRSLSDRDMHIYEKIHKNYNNLKNYTADICLTVYSNKTESQYFVHQKFLLPDKYFLRTTDENATFSLTTVTNGDITKTSADGSDYSLTVPSEDVLNLLFVNNFFKAYYSSEETFISVNSSLKNGKKTVLELAVHDKNSYISRASLSIDNETLTPSDFFAYDKEGTKVLSAEYLSYSQNEKMDDTIFNTQ